MPQPVQKTYWWVNMNHIENRNTSWFFSRRKLMASFCYLNVQLANASHQTGGIKMSEDVSTYGDTCIDLKNFERYWPKGRTVPKIIYEIAALISPWERGLLSQFYITASRPNDYFVENGADLWNQFGMFLGYANGTEYALWYYDSCPHGAEPVVSFGDEGDLRILAPNLKTFLIEWATGRGVGWLEPFDYEATPELLEKRKAAGLQILALVEKMPTPSPSTNIPDFEKFVDDFAGRAKLRNDADPTLLAIRNLLSKHIPNDDSNPRGKSFKLSVVDGKIVIDTALIEPDYIDHEPLPEREALIPLLTKARLEREAAQGDGRGPWISGVLYLQHGGHTFISGDWP
jgi:hypothetical protein